MQYLTACIKYHIFPAKGLLAPVFLVAKLTSSLRKIMKAIMTWLTITGIYVWQMTTEVFHLSKSQSRSLLIHDSSPGLYQE
jgi:hypothetical protein